MLYEANAQQDTADAVYIRYRLDGSLFNLRRLKAHTKTFEVSIRELLFADDAALVAHSETALQHLTSCFAQAAQLFGLVVSLKKTEVLHQPAPGTVYNSPHITIGNVELQSVNKFKYLGSIISSDAKIDCDVENRLANANKAFGRLYKRAWSNSELRLETKISLYKAIVLTTLLYGSESWVTYKHHVKLLERFHQRCLRNILHIKWWDFVSNIEVLEKAKINSIEALLLKNRLRWLGHVSRMDQDRLPLITLYGELSLGHRDVGLPKKRYKDLLKSSLSSCSIDQSTWYQLASNRADWRKRVFDGVSTFESERKAQAAEKRKRRKDNTAIKPIVNQSYSCSFCSRVCLSRIGLISHERACKKLV